MCLLTSSVVRAGPGKKGQVKVESAPPNPKKRKGLQNTEPDGAPAAKRARQAPVKSVKRKAGQPAQLPSQSTPGAVGGLAADDVQHGGEPFLIVGRNEVTGVR